MAYLLAFQIATILTIISFATVWFKRARVWQTTYGLTLAVGLVTGAFSIWSMATIVPLIVLIYLYSRRDIYSTPGLFGVLLLGLALSLHYLPGFNNHEFISSYSLNENSAAFSVWFNYDKSLFGILVLGMLFHQKLLRSWGAVRLMCMQLLPILLVGLPIVFLLGFVFGYSRFDWTPSPVFIPWAIKNLFFTVIAEEVMFRGLVQNAIARGLKLKYRGVISVLLAGMLFGAAHFAGGANYVLLSTVAGWIYGYAYYKTGRIEAAIVSHFLLNAIHFLCFSYPFLSGAI